MTVSILGCGWFGMALAKSLSELGIFVNASTTTPSKVTQLSAVAGKGFLVNIQSTNDSTVDPGFFYCDTLVIANNVKMKKPDEYLGKIHLTLSLIQQHGIKKVIFISSTSVYGDPNATVNELTAPAPESESGKMLFAAEKLFQHESSFTSSILRFAGLVGPDREPARFFAGKTNIPNGLAPVNLVHRDDCVAITQNIIAGNSDVPILNVVSPDHPSKAAFYTLAAQRKSLVLPSFLMEKNKWKVVDTNLAVLPGYQYTVNNWIDWLSSQ